MMTFSTVMATLAALDGIEAAQVENYIYCCNGNPGSFDETNVTCLTIMAILALWEKIITFSTIMATWAALMKNNGSFYQNGNPGSFDEKNMTCLTIMTTLVAEVGNEDIFSFNGNPVS